MFFKKRAFSAVHLDRFSPPTSGIFIWNPNCLVFDFSPESLDFVSGCPNPKIVYEKRNATLAWKTRCVASILRWEYQCIIHAVVGWSALTNDWIVCLCVSGLSMLVCVCMWVGVYSSNSLSVVCVNVNVRVSGGCAYFDRLFSPSSFWLGALFGQFFG